MANVTYLIGAGASAGKRDEKGNIIENKCNIIQKLQYIKQA